MGQVFVINDVLEVYFFEEGKLIVIQTVCSRGAAIFFLMFFGKQFTGNDDFLVALFRQVRYQILIEQVLSLSLDALRLVIHHIIVCIT